MKIGGGRAALEVSWQITGIRQDAWANANRIPVEEEKEASLKGFYLHPQLYGAPAEKGISWARHPEMMEKLQQDEEQMKENHGQLTCISDDPEHRRGRSHPPYLGNPRRRSHPPHRLTRVTK